MAPEGNARGGRGPQKELHRSGLNSFARSFCIPHSSFCLRAAAGGGYASTGPLPDLAAARGQK